jgi:ABC-type oligopeptide transport system substrate-binding subunit
MPLQYQTDAMLSFLVSSLCTRSPSILDMASNDSDQPNNENTQPTGDGPPKTAKQLAKEAEKAEKLRKFEEKQKAKALAEQQVSLSSINRTVIDEIRFDL